MEIKEMIYRRKSFRSYSKEKVSADVMADIDNFIKNAKPLYPDIKFSWEFVGEKDMKCIQQWRAPQYIAMYTEDKDGARENIGFIFQQTELYMQSIGLGTCWLGLGKLVDGGRTAQNGNMHCVMMMALGIPQEESLRTSKDEFNRKSLAEISDTQDERLECARIAPSAVNSQPWYFVHDGKTVHTYCMSKYLMHKVLGKMNKIDIGIALAHIYLENTETFKFFKLSDVPGVKGCYYIGSFEI